MDHLQTAQETIFFPFFTYFMMLGIEPGSRTQRCTREVPTSLSGRRLSPFSVTITEHHRLGYLFLMEVYSAATYGIWEIPDMTALSPEHACRHRTTRPSKHTRAISLSGKNRCHYGGYPHDLT